MCVCGVCVSLWERKVVWIYSLKKKVTLLTLGHHVLIHSRMGVQQIKLLTYILISAMNVCVVVREGVCEYVHSKNGLQ